VTELRTERLVLRPATEHDLDLVLALRNDPRVIPSTATGEALPRERMQGQIERWVALWRDRDVGTWIVFRDGVPIGWVDMNLYGDSGEEHGIKPDDIELGIVVHPDHWGQGIAGEAGLAVATDAFARAGLDRLYATADPGNAASLRAIAKAPGVRLVSERDDELIYELRAV
jgi:ribosomal-protein-alanine N-acetyltransferase